MTHHSNYNIFLTHRAGVAWKLSESKTPWVLLNPKNTFMVNTHMRIIADPRRYKLCRTIFLQHLILHKPIGIQLSGPPSEFISDSLCFLFNSTFQPCFIKKVNCSHLKELMNNEVFMRKFIESILAQHQPLAFIRR